jgi:predicted adenylyl cyclase CyaB
MRSKTIEMKAKRDDPSAIRDYLKKQNARFVGEDRQIDTYFNVPTGRLKLRESKYENFLVYYERQDSAQPKASHHVLHKVEPESSIKEMLTQSLGILCVVDKKREIYWLDNVKFHIDSVKELGQFFEIEAFEDTNHDETILRQQVDQYLKEFKVKTDDLVAGSYSDLILLLLKK